MGSVMKLLILQEHTKCLTSYKAFDAHHIYFIFYSENDEDSEILTQHTDEYIKPFDNVFNIAHRCFSLKLSHNNDMTLFNTLCKMIETWPDKLNCLLTIRSDNEVASIISRVQLSYNKRIPTYHKIFNETHPTHPDYFVNWLEELTEIGTVWWDSWGNK